MRATLVTPVIGVGRRGGRRWVYLDAGVYTGLVETLGEAIRYHLQHHSQRGCPRPGRARGTDL